MPWVTSQSNKDLIFDGFHQKIKRPVSEVSELDFGGPVFRAHAVDRRFMRWFGEPSDPRLGFKLTPIHQWVAGDLGAVKSTDEDTLMDMMYRTHVAFQFYIPVYLTFMSALSKRQRLINTWLFDVDDAKANSLDFITEMLQLPALPKIFRVKAGDISSEWPVKEDTSVYVLSFGDLVEEISYCSEIRDKANIMYYTLCDPEATNKVLKLTYNPALCAKPSRKRLHLASSRRKH